MNPRRYLAWPTAATFLATMAAGALGWPWHGAAGYVLVALAVWLSVWVWRGRQFESRAAAVVGLAAAALECVPGWVTLHACVAPVLFAALVVMARGMPERAPGSDAPRGLRILVALLPPAVFLQITLGAAYRHKWLGVMAHLAGAPVVAGLLLIACVMALQRYPDPGSPQRAAKAAMGIVPAQVSLGIADLILRLLGMDRAPALNVVAALHLCGAALTLAASVRLSLSVRGPFGGS